MGRTRTRYRSGRPRASGLLARARPSRSVIVDQHAFLTALPYRDENDALRAHLEATEQRLREAERAVAEANRRADAAEQKARAPQEARAPNAAAGPVDEHVFLRSAAVFWAWKGLAFVVWQVIQETPRSAGGVVTTLVEAFFLFALPSVLVLRRTARPEQRAVAHRSSARTATRVRVQAADRRARAGKPA